MSITLVGAFVVSPAATVKVVLRWRHRIVRAAHRVEDEVRRLLRRPRTINLTVHDSVLAMGSASGTVTVTGTATGVAPDDSVEGRLFRLEQRAAAAEARLGEMSNQAAVDRAAFREELGKVHEQQHTDSSHLRARLDYAEEQSVEVDAAALPVVALGVILSGLSPDAHRLPVVLWLLILTAALAVTLQAVRDARRRRHFNSVVPAD